MYHESYSLCVYIDTPSSTLPLSPLPLPSALLSPPPPYPLFPDGVHVSVSNHVVEEDHKVHNGRGTGGLQGAGQGCVYVTQ